MAKRNSNHQTKKKDDDKISLKEMLNKDVFEKLKEKQKTLNEEIAKKEEEERKRKVEAARVREKNKSFEELLNESGMDWKKFK